jgi:hypothetical protein
MYMREMRAQSSDGVRMLGGRLTVRTNTRGDAGVMFLTKQV